MSQPHHTLEGPPAPKDRASERRWTWISLATLGLVFLVTAGSVWLASRHIPILPSGPADHSPLPPAVKEEVLTLVAPHLDQVEFMEFHENGMREFRIKGRPRALLSMDFHRAFRPLVAQQLRPLLAPYGEVLSFDITSLDLPPVRLRAFGPPKGNP